MDNFTLNQLKDKWKANSEAYKTLEIGSGVHSFVSDMLESKEVFSLLKTPRYQKFGTFTHDTVLGKEGRPDFILYIEKEVTIPVEAKCFGRIKEGITQLQRYQIDYSKQYGILTDGNEWRFYRAWQYHRYFLEEILEKTDEFLVFWNDYIKPEYYYIEIFNPTKQQNLFEEKIDLNDAENRKIFFDDTTELISKFKAKMKASGVFDNMSEKLQVEISYAYLIQYILYKVLVDNNFKVFKEKFDYFLKQIRRSLKDNDFYSDIIVIIRDISNFISTKIYKPFSKEQEQIDRHLTKKLDMPFVVKLNDITPWLDIFIYMNKYNFANLKNEIFGFIYENYLKDLYQKGNHGQYFTAPAVVNFMLDAAGFNEKYIKENPDKISLIDPACGAGTFLYSAVDRIINSFNDNTKNASVFIENLVDKNIFGLDVEEFPLYLAEMSILMRLLPLIINDNFENPYNNKLKLFKTNDSISEFLDAGLDAKEKEPDLFSHLKNVELDYSSFMRDDDNILEMLKSMQGSKNQRLRFDFVFANPPYISYKDCSIMGIPFMKNENLKMNDVYGVNLHSIPNNIKKYAPTPNLYAFFVALGLALLKDDGKVCFIIPQTILIAEALDVLRYHLAKNTTIEKIITFSGNLFVERGLAQKKAVKTSSLIFVAKKCIPKENHKVEIVNYQPHNEKELLNIDDYLKNEQHKNFTILQSELFDKVENWNFLKDTEENKIFEKKYLENTQDIFCYYDHVSAKKKFGEIFYFDRGLKYPKNKITKNIEYQKQDSFLYIPKIKKYRIEASKTEFSIEKSLLNLPHGSQGLDVYHKKYKIVWRYMNYDKFNFSEDQIIIDYNNVLISSDCKEEMLYLLAILNSKTTEKIIKFYLHLDNEQDLTLGIKSIKQYIRVPIISEKNQKLKQEIIKQMKNLLKCENRTLADLVDFRDFMVQRFYNVQVIDNQLILNSNNKDFKLEIDKKKTDFVKKLISEKFYDNGLIFNREEVTLQELKDLEAIDFEQQEKLKQEIDTLVEKLYFPK